MVTVTDGFEVYNRSDLDAIASEMQFQQSGAVDDAQIRRIGKMAGVDFVLVTVLSADEGYLMVESKILYVESAQYDRAASKLMNMTPVIVEKTCLELAQSLFKINISSGIQNGEIMYNGYRYTGEYKDGKPNGKGKLYYNNNELDYYEGDFSDGLRSGYGKLFWGNGQRYEGYWKYDKFDGKGTLYYANGAKYVGTWENNMRAGKGKQYNKLGDLWYDGEWSKDQYHGVGTMYYTNNIWYKGEFRYGQKWGKGIEHYSSWQEIGSWVGDKKQGQFKIEWNDGHYQEGRYENDVKKGTWYTYNNNGRLRYTDKY